LADRSYSNVFERNRQIKLLSAREEKELAKRIEAGDEEAKNRLALANLSLCFHCQKICGPQPNLTLLDLIQEEIWGFQGC
jgi:RNA polymerase primary sigma factor